MTTEFKSSSAEKQNCGLLESRGTPQPARLLAFQKGRAAPLHLLKKLQSTAVQGEAMPALGPDSCPWLCFSPAAHPIPPPPAPSLAKSCGPAAPTSSGTISSHLPGCNGLPAGLLLLLHLSIQHQVACLKSSTIEAETNPVLVQVLCPQSPRGEHYHFHDVHVIGAPSPSL